MKINKLSFKWRIIFSIISVFTIFFLITYLILIFQLESFFNTSLQNDFDQIIEEIQEDFDIIFDPSYEIDKNIQLTIYDIRKNILVEKNHYYDLEFPYYLDKIIVDDLDNSDDKNQTFDIARYAEYLSINDNIYPIQLVKNIDYQNDVIDNMQILMSMTAILIIISLVIASYISTTRNLKIIVNIAEEAKNITINRLETDTKLEYANNNDEIGILCSSFNEMISRLNKSVTRQNEFISDASHELKTPIAIIKGYSDMLKRWGSKDEAILNESLNSIASEIDSMSKLLENLLSIAKFDKSKLRKEFEFINLSEEINSIKENFNFLYKESTFTVFMTDDEVFCNKHLMMELSRIIIENSIKYSDKSAKITIKGYFDLDNYIIEFHDEGIGIDEEYIDDIFERFYRVDKSRAKNTGGSGLGLSIAKEIVDVHNGTIKAQNGEEKGLIITVSIPAI